MRFATFKRKYTDSPWVYVRACAVTYLEECEGGDETILNFIGGCSITVEHPIDYVREKLEDGQKA